MVIITRRIGIFLSLRNQYTEYDFKSIDEATILRGYVDNYDLIQQ